MRKKGIMPLAGRVHRMKLTTVTSSLVFKIHYCMQKYLRVKSIVDQ